MNQPITLFCAQNVEQASAPGQKSRMLRFVALPGAQGPNAAIFKDGAGNCFIEIQNAAPEFAALFEAGATYTFTPAIVPASPA